MTERHKHPRRQNEIIYGERLMPGDMIQASDVYDSFYTWMEAPSSFVGEILEKGCNVYWVRPKLTWEFVKKEHEQHGERGLCAFEGCETEPCPTFRKIMPTHHWHGPDFGPGESCCGCGMTPEDTKRAGIEGHCPDDRVVTIK